MPRNRLVETGHLIFSARTLSSGSAFRPRTHPEGGPFYLRSKFLSYRGRDLPAGPRDRSPHSFDGTAAMAKCSKIREAWASDDRIGALRIAARFFDRSVDTQIFKRGMDAISATHPPGGGPFSFLATNFYLSRGRGSPAGQGMNNFLPGKTSYAPQSATSNSPVTIAARVAYFDTPHFDISAYFDAQSRIERSTHRPSCSSTVRAR